MIIYDRLKVDWLKYLIFNKNLSFDNNSSIKNGYKKRAYCLNKSIT